MSKGRLLTVKAVARVYRVPEYLVNGRGRWKIWQRLTRRPWPGVNGIDPEQAGHGGSNPPTSTERCPTCHAFREPGREFLPGVQAGTLPNCGDPWHNPNPPTSTEPPVSREELCAICETPMHREHEHSRCSSCGWIIGCCEGEPQ